jgi:hypothetical protein
MPTDLEDARSALLHDAKPPGWFIGRGERRGQIRAMSPDIVPVIPASRPPASRTRRRRGLSAEAARMTASSPNFHALAEHAEWEDGRDGGFRLDGGPYSVTTCR